MQPVEPTPTTQSLEELYLICQEDVTELEDKLDSIALALTAEDDAPYGETVWEERATLNEGWRLAIAQERRWKTVNPMSGFEGEVGTELLSYAVWLKALSMFGMIMYQRYGHGDPRVEEIKALYSVGVEDAVKRLSPDERAALGELIS